MGSEYKKYQRVGVFVDAQNIFYSARHVHRNSRVNYKKLIDKAVSERQLVRAIAYVVETPDVDQTEFRSMLEREGYEIKEKKVKIRSDGSMKADWDMGIAIDAISMAEKLDVMVLVSGDGDFVDMVNLMKSRGVVVEAISIKQSTSEDLIKAVNYYYPLETEDLIRAPQRSARGGRGRRGGRAAGAATPGDAHANSGPNSSSAS